MVTLGSRGAVIVILKPSPGKSQSSTSVPLIHSQEVSPHGEVSQAALHTQHEHQREAGAKSAALGFALRCQGLLFQFNCVQIGFFIGKALVVCKNILH